MKITNLRINGIVESVGFRYDTILCSWNVIDTESKAQALARIEVSLSEDMSNPILVREGQLKQSGESLALSLQPRTRYWFRVTVHGDQGDHASASSYFVTGKLNEPWTARWIAARDDFHPVLSRRFQVRSEIKSALLHVSGVGMFEAYLNGEKLGNEFFAPYFTDYETELQTLTFELNGLHLGENTLDILLGKGWYMGRYGLNGSVNNYGNRMAAIAELHIEYADGLKDVVITDESWAYRGSDIEDSGIYDGEILNRLLWAERPNPERPVKVIEPGSDAGVRCLVKEHLTDRRSLPVIIKDDIPVKEILYTPAGETVLDLGQNFTGYLEMRLDQPRGTRIELAFGEILQNECFYNGNYRGAKAAFVYISSGEPETVRAHFSFWGFRYVKLTGFVGEIRREDFTGKVLYSDLTRTGWFECGDARINRVYENTLWSMKSNFLDIPTDCPQRDERLGWTGDAQVFSPTANYHMDTRAFFRKFIHDLRCEQVKIDGAVPDFFPNLTGNRGASSVWGDIAAILPDNLYEAYGSVELFEEAYPLMRDWVDWITRRDVERGQRYLYDFGFHYGDWLALDGATESSVMGGTDTGYIGSVYYYNSALLAEKAAGILGYADDQSRFGALAERIRQAILDEYFSPNGRLCDATQTGYIIAMKYGVYPDYVKLREGFDRRMKRDLLTLKCGFVGAPIMCSVLADQGMAELAFDLLFHEGFPGWLYEVDHGATTIWERWNSVLEDGSMNPDGMNSLNHYAYGSVAEFLYKYVAGIRASKPGFEEVVIEPHIDGRLGHVRARYDSVNGTYACQWRIMDDGMLEVIVDVPFNGHAMLKLPGYPAPEIALDAGRHIYRYRADRDLRKPYHGGMPLQKLLSDDEAVEILKRRLPGVWQAAHGNEELGTLTLDELSKMPFMNVKPSELDKAIKEISEIIRWRQA